MRRRGAAQGSSRCIAGAALVPASIDLRRASAIGAALRTLLSGWPRPVRSRCIAKGRTSVRAIAACDGADDQRSAGDRAGARAAARPFLRPVAFVDGCDVRTELSLDTWRVYLHQYKLRDGTHDWGGSTHSYVILDRVGNCHANIPGTEVGAPR